MVATAKPHRPDLAAFLEAMQDPDERPLEANVAPNQFLNDLRSGHYG